LTALRILPRAFAFAFRNLLRQPGRAAVGVLGIAAVGALLFDMLLLSRGLVVSFRDLLNGIGYDVRVLTSDAAPIGGPRLQHAIALARELSLLPEIAEVVRVKVMDAEAIGAGAAAGALATEFSLTAMDPEHRRPWTLVAGEDDITSGLLVNRRLAGALRASPGDTVQVRVSCASNRALLPPKPIRVSGVADFPFDNASQLTAITSHAAVRSACGASDGDEDSDDADLLLIASSEGYGADAAVAAIRRLEPDLRPATNEEIVMRMQRQGFTYFRQISAVLSTITMLFGFLLITVLLTVSVNQRLGEIAALRALGFSRSRVAADVCCQSVLLVGVGGLLALPLGVLLSVWLDRILKAMPAIPSALHFFVFEPRALLLHVALLGVTATLAAAYPIRLVTTLPIAATLRNEVVG
jgi:putative ABC transport system permease protein